MCAIVLVLALFAAVIAAAPYPVLPSISSLVKAANQSVEHPVHKLAFKVPCSGCLASGDDAVLDFEIQYPHLSPTADPCTTPLALNGEPVTYDHVHTKLHPTVRVSASDWEVDLAVRGYCNSTESDIESPKRAFFFDINQIDDVPLQTWYHFTVVLPKAERAQVLVSADEEADDREKCAPASESVVDKTSSIFTELDIVSTPLDFNLNDIDLQEQILRKELYQQASEFLQLDERCAKYAADKLVADHLAAAQQAAERLADCHHNLPCLAKVMCQRIHEQTMYHIKQIQDSLQNSALVSKQRHDQYVAMDEKQDWNFNVTDIASIISDPTSKDDADTHNPIILALEIFAAVIGIGALYELIKNRFCSLRRRVERLADREERKRARHFRCLARREALRKKWVSFKGRFKRTPRNADYEEKRALILEAAGQTIESFNEGALESGEMQDALGDLQRAHDIVTAMVATQQQRTSHTSFDTRSRASSLPSYHEGKLPDYTSVTDSDTEALANRYRYAASVAPSRSSTAVTPDSSIVVTPRCSRETLRTGTELSRFSGDL